jgi:hypothetical protein
MKSTRANWPGLLQILSVFDGEGEGGEGQEQSGSGGAAAGNGDGAGGAGSPSGEGSSAASSGDSSKKIAALEDEKNRHWDAAKKAAQERDDALAKLKAIEDKDKTEDQKRQDRLTSLESENSELQAQGQKLALQNAFLSDNSFQWQNPAAALKLADLSKVEIKADGTVTGLKEALEALSKSDPYLLQPKKDPEDDGKGKPPPASGGAPAGGRGSDAAANKAALQAKYPALRGR